MDTRKVIIDLLKKYLSGEINTDSFCDNFAALYYYESNGREFFDEKERETLDIIGEAASRFSPYRDDYLNCPGAYYNVDDVKTLTAENRDFIKSLDDKKIITEIGKFKLDIDVEKTRTFYESIPSVTCECDGCKNYFSVCESFPESVKDFFESLGADVGKPRELMVLSAGDDGGSLCYGGFFHLCGKLLSDNDCVIPTGNGTFHVAEDDFFEISDGFSVGFTNRADMTDDGYPAPVVQMEIRFRHVPWILDGVNVYSGKTKRGKVGFIKKRFGSRTKGEL